VSKKQKFEAILIEMNRGGVGIEIPFNVPDFYGTKGQVKVKAKFNGYEYRGSITPMGGHHILGVRKDIRSAINKEVGDKIQVELEEDKEPRIVEVPLDFQNALAKNIKASKTFEKFAYTHRKEYVRWIESAKKPEIRNNRIQKGVEMIAENKKFS